MKRTAVVIGWLVAAAMPLLVAFVMLFGCCVLPFHRVIHKAMPFCGMAFNVLGSASHDAHSRTTTPAREAQRSVARLAITEPRSFQLARETASRQLVATHLNGYRSFIALGALRCDQDVGLHLLVATLLI
jgi:hypothetical protein